MAVQDSGWGIIIATAIVAYAWWVSSGEDKWRNVKESIAKSIERGKSEEERRKNIPDIAPDISARLMVEFRFDVEMARLLANRCAEYQSDTHKFLDHFVADARAKNISYGPAHVMTAVDRWRATRKNS